MKILIGFDLTSTCNKDLRKKKVDESSGWYMLPPSCHRLEYGASSKCLLQNLQLYKFGKESLEAKDNGSLLAYFSKFNLRYTVLRFFRLFELL